MVHPKKREQHVLRLPVRVIDRYSNTGRLRRRREDRCRRIPTVELDVVRQPLDGGRFDPAVRRTRRRADTKCVCAVIGGNRTANRRRRDHPRHRPPPMIERLPYCCTYNNFRPIGLCRQAYFVPSMQHFEFDTAFPDRFVQYLL